MPDIVKTADEEEPFVPPPSDAVITLRAMIKGAYDFQQLRIQMGNRLCAQWKVKRGVIPGQKESKEGGLSKEDKTLLTKLRTAYRLLTDGLIKFPKEKAFNGTDLISNYAEFCLVSQYIDLLKAEKYQFNKLEQAGLLDKFSIWNEWLIKVIGCGKQMSGVILSYINIHKAENVSKMWKFAGFDVVNTYDEDGKIIKGVARSRIPEHLVERTYTNKDGNEATRMGITFCPFLKTKLAGVLGGCFLRNRNKKYSTVYYNHRVQRENHFRFGTHNDGKIDVEATAEKQARADKAAKKGTEAKKVSPVFITSAARRHNQANRVMIKRFLQDLYAKWRALEGLPIREPWIFDQGGHPPHSQPEEVGSEFEAFPKDDPTVKGWKAQIKHPEVGAAEEISDAFEDLKDVEGADDALESTPVAVKSGGKGKGKKMKKKKAS